ncbi:uncharacterized protein LOC129749810 [Uranotaenia lowii]|uniref:uncharacterized protein LOC129749810 n=1 Tax=Uranotaenia lowii TaxID=190385 RepID=UPI002479E25C|nr:uncharacterized protein LOC129749810 [Uranotaenia lowii]
MIRIQQCEGTSIEAQLRRDPGNRRWQVNRIEINDPIGVVFWGPTVVDERNSRLEPSSQHLANRPSCRQSEVLRAVEVRPWSSVASSCDSRPDAKAVIFLCRTNCDKDVVRLVCQSVHLSRKYGPVSRINYVKLA